MYNKKEKDKIVFKNRKYNILIGITLILFFVEIILTIKYATKTNYHTFEFFLSFTFLGLIYFGMKKLYYYFKLNDIVFSLKLEKVTTYYYLINKFSKKIDHNTFTNYDLKNLTIVVNNLIFIYQSSGIFFTNEILNLISLKERVDHLIEKTLNIKDIKSTN